MQFGHDNNKTRIHINDADPNALYFCPYCGAPLTQRRGSVNIPHFAHKQGYLCTDTWDYPMSEWHVNWQSQYPMENREISLNNLLGQHRADVLVNKTVVEFQHSHISAEMFEERNAFYTACGYRVIWLFDARKDFQDHLTESDTGLYEWKYPPKMLTNFTVQGNVHVYFHVLDKSQQEGGLIIRLTNFYDGKLNHFTSASSERYTEKEFVELTYAGVLARENDVLEKEKLYHTLYFIRRTNGEKECYGCPINYDGYAPQIRESHRTTCEKCTYCKGEMLEPQAVKCAGRYRERLEQMVRVLRHFNNSLTYIDTDGNIQEAEIEPAPCPATSIIELSRTYNAKAMIVQNIINGKKYKIIGNVEQMSRKYNGRIYGYYYGREGWLRNSDTIYYPLKPEWIVIWFKK